MPSLEMCYNLLLPYRYDLVQCKDRFDIDEIKSCSFF